MKKFAFKYLLHDARHTLLRGNPEGCDYHSLREISSEEHG
jgi:hypothetical protein